MDNDTTTAKRHRWNWMTPWERHCERLGLDPDDLQARDDYNEAAYEDQRWPDL